MFEEPIRFFMDVVWRIDRSRFLYADDTFVNPVLARHYDLPASMSGRTNGAGCHANRYGRGAFLPMSVFLTKNAPGWDQPGQSADIGSPPFARRTIRRRPKCSVLPSDEAKLGDLSLRDLLPAPAGQKLRRLPRSLRRYRAGLRRIWSSRRNSVSSILEVVRWIPTDISRGSEGSDSTACGVTCAKIVSRISSTIYAARC